MITAVILTHNDEKIIERCLKSVEWCDEIVVIDDNSTDKTVEVAKKTGAQVFLHSLSDDFAQQRNFGLSQTRGDWVLFVDSDEVVPEALRKEIQKVILFETTPTKSRHGEILSSGAEAPSGYYVRRIDWFFGRWLNHGETARMRLLRLARKGAGEWLRPVHEVWQVKGPVGELVSPLFHYSHPNVAQFLEEINHYSSLNARYLKSLGITASWWQVVAYPLAKFLVNYIWRLGFLDGTPGVIVAIIMSFHSFLTRAKLYLLNTPSRAEKIKMSSWPNH